MQLLKSQKKYVITACVALVICLFVMVYEIKFKNWGNTVLFRVLSDGFFVSGVIVGGVGFVAQLFKMGALDILMYSGYCIFYHNRSSKFEEKKSYYDYVQENRQLCPEVQFILIIGCVFVLIGLILGLIYYFTR